MEALGSDAVEIPNGVPVAAFAGHQDFIETVGSRLFGEVAGKPVNFNTKGTAAALWDYLENLSRPPRTQTT